jgi:hypothetical protein
MANKRVSVTWNGSAFVLSHTNDNGTSTYKYSIDGENWEQGDVPNLVVNSPINTKVVGNRVVILGNLATSSGNVFLTSYDGIHFGLSKPDQTKQIYDMETNTELKHTIRFPHSVFLAVGAGSVGTIAYSLDNGDTWTLSPSSIGVFSNFTNASRWNGHIWVSVGSGNTNTIATSVDGEHWIGRGKYVFSNSGTSIDWSKETHLWVATGNDTSMNGYSIAYSVDGIHWIGKKISGILSGVSVKWNGELWVLAGIADSTVAASSIAYSRDGIHWTRVPNTFSIKATRVEWSDMGWTVFGEDPSWNIANSSNGIDWQMTYSDNRKPSPFYDDTTFWECSGNTYSTSMDGVHWNTFMTTDISLSEIRQFAKNTPNEATANIFPITVATGAGQNTLAYSHDGIFWMGLGKTIFSERSNNAVWNGKIWVAVGKGGYWVATSYDGILWEGRDSIIMNEGFCVAWNGTLFVAVGKGNASIATSHDGISWNPVSNSTTLFSEHASKVCWTGKVWLAYGSGTNTTAMSIDGIQWTLTPVQNAVIYDASSVFWQSGYFTNTSSLPSGISVSSSSEQTGYESYYAFDNSANTSWNTSVSTYNSGEYTGSSSTIYSVLGNTTPTSQTASGEWITLSLPSPEIVKYYSIGFSTGIDASMTQTDIPKQWILLGSNNGSNWSEIHSFQFQSQTPPNNKWKYSRFMIPISIYSNTTAYSYYRVVVLSTFGETFASIQNIDLYIKNANTPYISRYETPISLKNNVLFHTGIISLSVGSRSVYSLADLSLNSLNEYPINAGQYVNSALFGIGGTQLPVITSVCFDGEYTYITDISGDVIVMTNAASNSHYNTDTVINGLSVNTQLSAVYTSCWNQQFVLFGGEGGISYGVSDTNKWHLTNAGQLFHTVYCVASNSGYGFVYIPNVLYFHSDDTLKVVGPKSQSFTGETDIHFQLRNTNKR